MSKIKKLLSSLIIFVFLAGILNINISFASEKNLLIKELIITKNYLEKQKDGETYIMKLNIIANALKSQGNIKKIEQLVQKIDIILENFKYQETPLSRKQEFTKQAFLYFKISLELKLLELENDTLDHYEELDDSYKDYPIKENKDLFKSDLNKEEIKMIEDEIIELQLNLFEKGNNTLKNIIDEFEKLSKYEEEGDLSMDLNINHEMIGKIESGLSISDYKLKNSNFDGQFKGKINSFLNAIIDGEEEEIKFEISGFIDFISKDGNMYVLLENFDISAELVEEEIKEIVNILEKVASQNKYIKIEDKASTEILNMLKNFSPDKISSKGKEVANKAFFTPYKKDHDRYLLKPTKYACDKIKELEGVFDPFYANDRCSVSQYQDLLEEMAYMGGELYIITGEENQIGYNISIENDVDMISFVIYDDKAINQISINITPDQKIYPDEGFELMYRKNKDLYSRLYAEKGDIEYNFESKLDKNNRFEYIDFKGHTIDEVDNAAIIFKLENNKINGEMEFNNEYYNWYDDSYTEVNTKININGKTDYKNKLDEIELTTTSKKAQEETFNGSFKYKSGEINFGINTSDNYFKAEIEASAEWDSEDKYLKAGDLNISFQALDYFSEDETKKEIFSSKLNLKNKIISGTTKAYDKGEEVFTINHSGKHEKNYFELNNKIELTENPFDNPWSNTYSEETKEKIISNFNITTDLRNNSNKLKLYYDFNVDDDKIMEFRLKNDSKKEYKNLEIKAPNNYKTLEEILIENY